MKSCKTRMYFGKLHSKGRHVVVEINKFNNRFVLIPIKSLEDKRKIFDCGPNGNENIK